MKLLAIIPARGGSTRVPRKNLQEVGGMTLVERAINVAKAVCPLVMVSTDDTEVEMRVRSMPACAYVHMRGNAASGDRAMQDVLDDLGEVDATRVLLQPSTPGRTVSDVARAMAAARSTGLPTQTVHRTAGHAWVRNGAAIVLPPLATLKPEVWAIVETPERLDINTPEDLERARRMAEENGW